MYVASALPYAGVMVKFDSATGNKYYFYWDGTKFELFRFKSSITTSVATSSAYSLTAGQTYNLRCITSVASSQTTIKLQVNGVDVINFTDSAANGFTTGDKVGFFLRDGTASTGLHFDSITGETGAPSTGTTISGTVGDAAAQGQTATISGSLTIGGTVGDAAAEGQTATITNGGFFAVDNSALNWSPYNWDTLEVGDFSVTTKTKQTSCCGAYLKFRATGTTSIVLNVDGSTLSGVTSPLLIWTINNGTQQSASISSATTSVTLGSSLTTGTTYSVELWVYGMDSTSGNRWGSAGVSPTNVVRINGVTLTSGGTLSAPALVQPRTALFFGDSITEGRAVVNTTQPNDHGRSYAWFVGTGMACEYGIVGYGSQGWQLGGTASIPTFITAWNYHSSGRARSFSTPPDYVFVGHGANGTNSAATITTWLGDARAAFGANTWIILISPFGGKDTSIIATGVANYQTANPNDKKILHVDISDIVPTGGMTILGSPTFQTSDGLHPRDFMHAMCGGAILSKVRSRVALKGSQRTAQVTLVDAVGSPRTSLTGLKWAFYDQATPDIHAVPSDMGVAETTDGSGVLTIPLNTSLSAGQTGWLTVTDSDGTTSQSPAPKAFSGPVQVS
jgi:hypothetical protein